MNITLLQGLHESKLTTICTSSYVKPFPPCHFLDMPIYIRRKIYELIVGDNQRVQIKSDLEDFIPRSIIPCSDHGSAGCLLKIYLHEYVPQSHCWGTGNFSHMRCASSEAKHADRQPQLSYMTCGLASSKLLPTLPLKTSSQCVMIHPSVPCARLEALEDLPTDLRRGALLPIPQQHIHVLGFRRFCRLLRAHRPKSSVRTSLNRQQTARHPGHDQSRAPRPLRRHILSGFSLGQPSHLNGTRLPHKPRAEPRRLCRQREATTLED